MGQSCLVRERNSVAVLLLTFDTKFVFLITPSHDGISKQAKQKRKGQGTRPTGRESPSLIRKGELYIIQGAINVRSFLSNCAVECYKHCGAPRESETLPAFSRTASIRSRDRISDIYIHLYIYVCACILYRDTAYDNVVSKRMLVARVESDTIGNF